MPQQKMWRVQNYTGPWIRLSLNDQRQAATMPHTYLNRILIVCLNTYMFRTSVFHPRCCSVTFVPVHHRCLLHPPAAAAAALLHLRLDGVGACVSCDHVLTIPWAAMRAARVLLPEVPGVQSDRRTSWPPTSVRSISISMASACSALSYSTTPKPRTGLPSS